MVAIGRRTLAWSSATVLVVAISGAAFFVARGDGSPVVSDVGSAPAPTRTEAEALLAEAYGLAQATDHTGLCQAIAQNPEACRKILEWAYEAHAMPSAESPSIIDVSAVPRTRNTQETTALRIHGTRADGTPYTSVFSAVRTESGEVRSQNAVYWYSSLTWPTG